MKLFNLNFINTRYINAAGDLILLEYNKYNQDLHFFHFDRRAPKWTEAEKSVKKISRLRFAALSLGEPNGGNDSNKHIYYLQVIDTSIADLQAISVC